MAQEQDARTVRHARPDCLDNLVDIGERHRQWLDEQSRLAVLGDEGPGPLECAVFVVGRQNLVAWLEWQRPGDDVERRRDVRNVDHVVGSGVEVVGQFRACLG